METKKCASCKQIKPVENFAFRNKSKGTRQSQCDPCRRATAKKHYENNKIAHIERAKRNTKNQRIKFQKWKEQQSCCVCGEDESICLDFHHNNSDQKDSAIGSMIGVVGIGKIIQELEKCICVCSNCHRKIHANIISAPLVKLDITQLYES